ncbi:HEAT repeat domain-containing protein [Streptomyces sp. NPDC001404]|uniref:HEAT repeat domain-containing protein n=1 Tax=Streptomyces sp. NPDC001404 TaxID=3364571 RepID=UPI0036AC0A7F
MTHADLVATASGQMSGILHEPVTGEAAMAWSDGRLYLKGDNDFWAQQGSFSRTDLPSSGHWIAPKMRSGHHVLDSFGVNAGSLSPKSLAALVRQVTSDPGALQEDAETIEGHKAISYTAEGWTVVLASSAPYTVLAIGGDPLGAGPIGPTASADYNKPYLVMTPKPATEDQAADVRSAATEAAAAAPASSDDAVSQPQGPKFTITDNSANPCTTDPCSYSFTVTNSGDTAGEATLYLDFPNMPEQPHPLGTLKPGQFREVNGTRPDVVSSGRFVQQTDYAWVYSPSLYGQDPDVGSRLRARGLRPEAVPVATPLKPTVAKLLDLMTRDAPAADTKANDKAVEALGGAADRGRLPALAAIAGSGRLTNPENLREVVPATAELGGQRVMEQVAHLLKTDPNAKVTWGGLYKADGDMYKADYIYTSTQHGREVKRAVQVKAVNRLEELWALTGSDAEQPNGERSGSGNSKGEKAPPGFERVLQISLEPTVGPLFSLASTADLQNFLSTGPKFRQMRDSLCKSNGGSRVDRLVIANESGAHLWTDLSRLGAHC